MTTRRRLIIEIEDGQDFDYEKPLDMVGATVSVVIPRSVLVGIAVDTRKGVEEIEVRATHGARIRVVADPGPPPGPPVP